MPTTKSFPIPDLLMNSISSYNALVVPRKTLDRIVKLCAEGIEYCGYLVTRNSIVEYPYISGCGNGSSVYPKTKLLFDSSEYSAIEFHTHPEKLGIYWSDSFSGGDINTFEERVKQEGKEYRHVLFTHTNVLTWSDTGMDVRVGFGSNDEVERIFN